MVSATEQKERLVLDLHGQGKNSRSQAQSSRITGVSRQVSWQSIKGKIESKKGVLSF